MKPERLRQFVRFGLVGLQGLAVDLLVLYTLAPLSNWYAARVVSFWAAASSTWLLNRKYTFVGTAGPTAHTPPTWQATLAQYGRYLTAMLAGGALNYLCYFLVLRWLHIPHAAVAGVMLGSAAGMVLNFWLSHTLVFRQEDRGQE